MKTYSVEFTVDELNVLRSALSASRQEAQTIGWSAARAGNQDVAASWFAQERGCEALARKLYNTFQDASDDEDARIEAEWDAKVAREELEADEQAAASERESEARYAAGYAHASGYHD